MQQPTTELEALQRKMDDMTVAMAEVQREADKLRAESAERDKIIEQQRKEIAELKKGAGGVGDLRERVRQLEVQHAEQERTMRGAATATALSDLQKQVDAIKKELNGFASKDYAREEIGLAHAEWEEKVEAGMTEFRKDLQSVGGTAALLMEDFKEKAARNARAYNVVVNIAEYLERSGAAAPADTSGLTGGKIGRAHV